MLVWLVDPPSSIHMVSLEFCGDEHWISSSHDTVGTLERFYCVPFRLFSSQPNGVLVRWRRQKVKLAAGFDECRGREFLLDPKNNRFRYSCTLWNPTDFNTFLPSRLHGLWPWCISSFFLAAEECLENDIFVGAFSQMVSLDSPIIFWIFLWFPERGQVSNHMKLRYRSGPLKLYLYEMNDWNSNCGQPLESCGLNVLIDSPWNAFLFLSCSLFYPLKKISRSIF